MDENKVELAKTKIYELSERISKYSPSTKKYTQKKDYIQFILKQIADFTPDSYYETCPYCTKHELPTILKWSDKEINDLSLDFIFSRTMRYAKEALIRRKEFSRIEIDILRFYDEYQPLTNEERADSILINFFDSNTIFNKTEEITTLNSKITDNIEIYNSTLKEWSDKIETYRSELEKHYTNYNFVCLSQAFSTLLSTKKWSLFWNALLLTLLSLLIIAIPTSIPFLVRNGFMQTMDKEPFSFLPFLTALLILIYYFRITFHQYNNTKLQILQIELRRAICAFSEGYINFKKGNPDLIPDKFETLIFSPIAVNPEKIPSTLDGFEQLSKLIKECKTT